MDTGDSLQAYFEQQNDKEAASIVAAMMALLPSNSSVISWDDDKEIEDNSMNVDENVLNNNTNFLLTKESEISALKEVIIKWRTRALEAESNAQTNYLGLAFFLKLHNLLFIVDTFFSEAEQLQIIELQHENELRLMESRYTRKLYEKEDVILSLNDQIDYLISNKHHAEDGDTESFVSTIDYSDEELDTSSSIYDRDVEQGLTIVGNRPSTELKSENILGNIQVTMRAIEQELNSHATNDSKETVVSDSGAHNTRRHHRRSPTYNSANTYFSSATLIESELGNNKKIKKQGFSINRIFKKAFPKLYKKHTNINTINSTNLKYTKSLPASQVRRNYHIDSALFENDSSSIPRSSTDETLGVYSTTSSSDFRKPVNVIDLLPAMNNNAVLV
ncbi:hypothetical protein HPULCUR_011413 [Helicostylum pulchrum]|uniref:Uncharacterized protein n=1 Tax=Helicostylum pulchrum TaxID=562976 RepID=A0ABP9YG11_9FUNG